MNNVWEHTVTQETIPVTVAHAPIKITDVMHLISSYQSRLMALILPVYPHVLLEVDEWAGG